MTSKKLLIPFAFLFFFNYSYSQDTGNYDPNYYVNLYRNNSSPDSLAKSYKFFKNRKEESIETRYYADIVYCLLHLSSIEDRFGQYIESEKSAVLGIEYLDSLSSEKYKIFYRNYLYNRLGNVMERYGNYDKAIEYYFKSIQYFPKKSNLAVAYNNIGSALVELDKYNEARDTLKKAFNIAETLEDSAKYSLITNNLGYVEAMLGDIRGIKKINEAIQIRKEQQDPLLYDSYKTLFNYHSKRGPRSKSIIYALESYRLAKEMGNLQFKKESLTELMELGLNDYGREYYKTMVEFLELNNSLKNTFAEAKYSVDQERKKTEIEKVKRIAAESDRIQSEIESQRNLLITVLVIIISLFLLLTIRARYRRNIIIKQFETEQRISKKLHDEVANDVFYVMTKVQGDQVNKPDLLDDLDGIYNKTRDISKANSELDVSKEYISLLNDLIQSYKTYGVNIITKDMLQVSWDDISDQKKRVLYRVLQELMTNMKKHSDATLVTLNFTQDEKKLYVVYIDNGVGCDIYKGNGLRNTENRIDMVGGKITFESEPGNGFQAKIRM